MPRQESQLDPEIKKVLARCSADTGYAGKVFFPDRFSRPYDPIHRKIFDAIDNMEAQKIAIAVPRGLGKTSICNLLVPAKNILFRDSEYIVPVSCSATQATQQSENLKYKLLNNDKIQRLFGDLKTNEKFSKEQYVVNVLGEDICVMPRGAGQQVRGLLFRDSRPDLIIVDDLEDPDDTYTEAQREKISDWFFGDLVNSVDRGSDDWRIIVLGTVLHPDSLLVNLLNSDYWESVEIPICDPNRLQEGNFKSFAPNFLDDEQVEELYFEFQDEGKSDTFAREYLNQPTAQEEAEFSEDLFKYYEEKDHNLNDNPTVANAVLIDPARTKKLSSAETGIVGVGVDIETHAIYVRDIVAKKMHPDELYDEIFDMTKRLNADVLGVEVTGLHEFVTYPILNEMRRRAQFVELVELHARGGRNEKGKVQRIRSLVSFYRQGLVYHNKTRCGPLELQLKAFPRPQNWDVMDAFGYLPEMLDKGQIFMSLDEDDYQESRGQIEQEYREIERQTPREMQYERTL